MLWGSFQTTKLVSEFAKHHFIDHPKIASMLVITLMQKERQVVKQLEMDVKQQTGTIDGLEKRLKAVKNKK